MHIGARRQLLLRQAFVAAESLYIEADSGAHVHAPAAINRAFRTIDYKS